MNVVIMAGGGGSRLWPLSRKTTPKQFLDLGRGRTLLEDAYARSRKIADASQIYIATSENYRAQIEKLLPSVAPDHIFYEPEKRDTTAAFATIAVRLEKIGQGDEPAIFMWSDHVFTNEAEFIRDLERIPRLLAENPEAMVIMAHTPVTAETGFGYVEVGEALPNYPDVFPVKAFKEKPDAAAAAAYVVAGNFYWNLGYFSAKPTYILRELVKHNPELKPAIDAFSQNQDSSTYALFPKVAIEYTLIEKTPRRLAITGDYGWSDIGNWSSVQQIFGAAGDHMPAGHHIHVDSQNNYIYNTTSRAVSLVGVQDTIVVVTEDAVLVTNKNQAHKVKQVVEKLEAEGKSEYL